jgi:hypothetical protein
MLLKMLSVMILAVVVMGECTSEVFAVLAGFPYTYSSQNPDHHCQLNQLDNNVFCWCSEDNNQQQWAQVSSINPEKWIAVVTQGRPTFDQRVTQYRVSYSLNGADWTFVDNGKVFNGNSNRSTRMRNDF